MIDHVYFGRVPTRLTATDFSAAISKLNREAATGRKIGVRYSAAALGLSVKNWNHILRAKLAVSAGENVVMLGVAKPHDRTENQTEIRALKGAAK